MSGDILTQRRKGAEVAEKVRLGEVCSASTSQIRQKDLDNNLGPYPIYGASGVIKHVDFYQTEVQGLGVIKDGAGVGHVMRLPPFSSVIGTVMIIHPQAGVDSGYLYYALAKQNLGALYTGATIPHLYFKDFKDRKINLPPLSAQKRIAGELDKICELKKNAETRLEKLDLLVKSRFVEMFGDGKYPERELITVTTFIDYRGKTPTKSDSGIPLITAKNVRTNGFSVEPREYMPEELFVKWMTRGFPRVGDILFTTEAPLGNVCRIPNLYDRFAVGQRIVTMQVMQDVLDSSYLEHALKSDTFQRKIKQKSSGSTVTGIRSKLLEKLTVPIPPLSLQREFAAFVEKVDKLKDVGL